MDLEGSILAPSCRIDWMGGGPGPGPVKQYRYAHLRGVGEPRIDMYSVILNPSTILDGSFCVNKVISFTKDMDLPVCKRNETDRCCGRPKHCFGSSCTGMYECTSSTPVPWEYPHFVGVPALIGILPRRRTPTSPIFRPRVPCQPGLFALSPSPSCPVSRSRCTARGVRLSSVLHFYRHADLNYTLQDNPYSILQTTKAITQD